MEATGLIVIPLHTAAVRFLTWQTTHQSVKRGAIDLPRFANHRYFFEIWRK
jgi:hypothetical protein